MEQTLANLIAIMGLLGLAGCYDIARRMSFATRHGMRLAVIVIGIGCVAAMAGERDAALLLLLLGCGMYRFFDLRIEGWHVGRNTTTAGGLHSVANAPPERPGGAHEPAAPPGDAMGRLQLVSSDRQGNHVNRAAA